MAYKDLGPNVSQKPQAIVPGGGQFTAEDHSFEQVVFQTNKPIADWELNLQSEIFGASGQRLLTQKSMPSCFLTGDFLETSDETGSYSFLTPDPPAATTANQFQLAAADLNVNGWLVRFDLTASATIGVNLLQLPAPPVGANTTRTDFVFLEVWRALVSPGIPDNKSPTGQILRYGNAKASDSFPPGNENLADDLIDPNFAAMTVPIMETTRRVQIQYRYRVVSGIDLSTYPDGLDSPALFANTVPYLGGSTVDGNVTAFNYIPSTVDAGLWVAGNGTPGSVTTLGTVDGFIYAIPICAVFRRNSSAFQRSSNMNGAGLMASGVSGRPDGLYADQIVASDILDLRKGVTNSWEEVMEKALQQVFDNTMTTHQEITATGPGGTSIFAKASIGVGNHIGTSDSVRRYFTDRSYSESIVAKHDVVGATSTVSFNLSAITLSWDSSPVNLLSLSPTGTNIVTVLSVRITDTTAHTDHWALSIGSPLVTSMNFHVAVGPAIDEVTITFDVPISNVTVYADLVIEYPADNGVNRNMLSAYQFWMSPVGAPAWIDQTGWTATSDPNRSSLPTTSWWIDPGHRELAVQMTSVTQTNTFYTAEGNILFVWERLNGDPVTINDGVNPIYNTTNYFSLMHSVIILTGAITIPAGSAVTVTYKAIRALPPVAAAPFDSFQLFYQSAAIQSLPVPAGSQTLSITPRKIGKSLYVITNGSGSPDAGFPYAAASSQIPVGLLPSGNYPESRLDTPNSITMIGFGINTGFVQVVANVPYSPSPGQVTLYSSGLDTTVDGDNRNFWPKSDNGLTPIYSPIAYGPPLANNQRHKVVLPVLMELRQDFPSIGRKGTLVLVIVTRWLEYDNQNSVSLTSTPGDTCAAVYKVRGNLMNPKRSNP